MSSCRIKVSLNFVLFVKTVHMLHTVACPCVVNIAEAQVECKTTITLLGVLFDASLLMDKFVNSKTSSVVYHLRHAIVLSRFDYC